MWVIHSSWAVRHRKSTIHSVPAKISSSSSVWFRLAWAIHSQWVPILGILFIDLLFYFFFVFFFCSLLTLSYPNPCTYEYYINIMCPSLHLIVHIETVRRPDRNLIRDELSSSVGSSLFEISLPNKQYSMSPSLLNSSGLENSRLREELVNLSAKQIQWEDRVMQASKACEAWKSEVDDSNRKVSDGSTINFNLYLSIYLFIWFFIFFFCILFNIHAGIRCWSTTRRSPQSCSNINRKIGTGQLRSKWSIKKSEGNDNS